MDKCNFKQGSLPECAPLALAQTPMQQSNEPAYDRRMALARGTLFPGLDLPFMNMVNKRTKFNDDGSILESGDGWTKKTVFNADESIDETFTSTNKDGTTKTVVKHTTFGDIIKEEITQSYVS